MNADLRELSRYVFDRTRRRLDGLTDDEYLWEPSPHCWSIRPRDSSVWEADGPLTSGVGP